MPLIDMTPDTQAVINTLRRIHKEQMAIKDREIRLLRIQLDKVHDAIDCRCTE